MTGSLLWLRGTFQMKRLQKFLAQLHQETLYYKIATHQEKVKKAPEKIFYNAIDLPETRTLYLEDNRQMDFTGKIIEIFAN